MAKKLATKPELTAILKPIRQLIAKSEQDYTTAVRQLYRLETMRERNWRPWYASFDDLLRTRKVMPVAKYRTYVGIILGNLPKDLMKICGVNSANQIAKISNPVLQSTVVDLCRAFYKSNLQPPTYQRVVCWISGDKSRMSVDELEQYLRTLRIYTKRFRKANLGVTATRRVSRALLTATNTLEEVLLQHKVNVKIKHRKPSR